MSIYDVFSGGNRPFDKEEWAAAKQAQRKEAYELIDNTCSEMMASGDSFRQYLNAVSYTHLDVYKRQAACGQLANTYNKAKKQQK